MTEKPNSGFNSSATIFYFGLVLLMGLLSIVLTQLVLNSGIAMTLDSESNSSVLFISIAITWFLIILIGILSQYIERWMTRYQPDRRSAWTWATYGMLIAIVLLLADIYVLPPIWSTEEVMAVSLTFKIRVVLPASVLLCLILLLGDREQRRLKKYSVVKYIRPGSS